MLRQSSYFEAKWAYSRRGRSGSFTFSAGWCRLTYSGIFDLQKLVVLASHDHSPRNRLSHFNAKFWRGAANEAAWISFRLVGEILLIEGNLLLFLFLLFRRFFHLKNCFNDESLMVISQRQIDGKLLGYREGSSNYRGSFNCGPNILGCRVFCS